MKSTLSDQHTRTIRSVGWSPDGELLASAGFDSQLNIWLKKEDNFECVAAMEGHENEVK
jgi:FOG: WD40 repeat